MSHDNTSAEKTGNGANHNNNNTDQKKKTSKVNSSVQAALQANHIKVLVQY